MNKPINIFKEQVCNENGIQEYVITPVNDYYSVKYTTDRDNDVQSIDLYTEYGEKELIIEFKAHMKYGLNSSLWTKYTVLDVYVYSYEMVDYRHNIEGEKYISYDLTRYKINTNLKERL